LTRRKTYDYIVKLKVRLRKLAYFEYWPILFIYVPLMPRLFVLFVRTGSFLSFRDTNPGFIFKTRLRESKMDILNSIPSKWLPKTMFLKLSSKETWLAKILSFHPFPIVCKPELGERGRGVSLIKNSEELAVYLNETHENIIVQEYIHYPIELGIFYIRIPGEESGFITSIVRKEPMQVVGDGKSSLRNLMENDLRYLIQLLERNKELKIDLDAVLDKDEVLILDPIASHSRGSKFIDCFEFLHPELECLIDEIANEIKGFYYGRFDIKIESEDAFKKGKGIKIIELNGIWSEPTHIYDPSHGILDNYKTIMDHFNYAYRIAVINRKDKLKN